MDHGVAAHTWLALAAMILAAKLGGEVALRLRQPAVLGELACGVLLGNLPIPWLTEVARGAEIVVLDGPLHLESDRVPGLRYSGSTIHPPDGSFWGQPT